MMKKWFVLLLLIVVLVIVIFERSPAKAYHWLKNSQFWHKIVNQERTDGISKKPLRGPVGGVSSGLSAVGVVEWTNISRGEQNLPPLIINSFLTQAAQNKLQDMFTRQYFEHKSPNNLLPADVVKQAGYEFLVVGENLALGNYKNDQALVEAWMSSPGHRANIVDTKFREIGVAVSKGWFEGVEVWLAVQEFGTPLSICQQPDHTLKTQIDQGRQLISEKESSLNKTKTLLDHSTLSRQAFEQAVEQYNSNIGLLNQLIEQTKELVVEYNSQISQFNQCLEANG